MVKTNRVIRKIVIFNTIILLSLYLISYWGVNIILKKANKFIFESSTIEILSVGEHLLGDLQNSINILSNNEDLKEILVNSNLDSNNIHKLQEEIKIAEESLSIISLKDYLKIYDFSNNTLYTGNSIQENYKIYEMIFFDELLTKKYNNIGLVYEEESKKEELIIIDYIKEKEDVIGVAIINIDLDDFLEFMEEVYVNGEVDILIRVDDEKYYSNDLGFINSDELTTLKGVTVDKDRFVFLFDESSTIFSKLILELKILNSIILIAILILSTIMFKYIRHSILKPLLSHIDEFKNLLKLLNKYDKEIEEKEDEEQLEIVLNALNKSIDENLRKQVYYDDLTNLLNRKGLKREFIKFKNKNKRFAIIFIDINKFKEINDTYGHLVGDRFLKEFSKILSELLKDKGILTRLAGDEFVILYYNYKSEEELTEFYKRILDKFEEKKVVDNLLEVKFSAGVAIYPDDGESFEELIKKSDHMMYSDKNNLNGGMKIRFFDDKVYSELSRVDLIKSEIKYALCKGEFKLLYQVIIDRNKKIEKIESLLSWKNDKLGVISQDEFMKYLEEDRLIIPLGYWCIEVICKEYLYLIQNNIKYKDVIMTINIRIIQLMEVEFALNFKNTLDKYKIDYSKIEVEVKEAILTKTDENISKNLLYLKRLGINFSLGNFGIGYTSFVNLRNFKLKSIKVDKYLLNKADKEGYEIITFIIDTCHKLDINVVMEGIESNKQFNILFKLGCDFFQGNYISKPVALDELKDVNDKLNIDVKID